MTSSHSSAMTGQDEQDRPSDDYNDNDGNDNDNDDEILAQNLAPEFDPIVYGRVLDEGVGARGRRESGHRFWGEGVRLGIPENNPHAIEPMFRSQSALESAIKRREIQDQARRAAGEFDIDFKEF